jgi:hypothetical protein
MITYEPCEETENETALTHDALLITDIKATETKEVCAYFSFPMELYGVSEKTHFVVSELDYVLPTRSTFTLKANVQVYQSHTREDESLMLTVEKDESITHQIDEREKATEASNKIIRFFNALKLKKQRLKQTNLKRRLEKLRQ